MSYTVVALGSERRLHIGLQESFNSDLIKTNFLTPQCLPTADMTGMYMIVTRSEAAQDVVTLPGHAKIVNATFQESGR